MVPAGLLVVEAHLLPFRVRYLFPHEPLPHEGADDLLLGVPGLLLRQSLGRDVGLGGREVGGVEQRHLRYRDMGPLRASAPGLRGHILGEILESQVEFPVIGRNLVMIFSHIILLL